jgi:RHS repeat-associated protein
MMSNVLLSTDCKSALSIVIDNGNVKSELAEIGTGFQDYGFREYDSRIARFISVDPLTSKYPWYTPYQFAGNKPIKYIDIDGLEEGGSGSDWMINNPVGVVLEGAREYFDAAVNFFTGSSTAQVAATYTNSQSTVGNTTNTNTTSYANTTTVAYTGWDLFKPSAYSTGNNTPAPKITVSNETSVVNKIETKTTAGPVTVTKSSTQSSNGVNTTSTSGKIGGVSNSGTPVSLSLTSTTSNKTGTTTTAKLTVGSDVANIYGQVSTNNNGSGQTTTATAGASAQVTTPSLYNWSFSAGVDAKVSVPIQNK